MNQMNTEPMVAHFGRQSAAGAEHRQPASASEAAPETPAERAESQGTMDVAAPWHHLVVGLGTYALAQTDATHSGAET